MTVTSNYDVDELLNLIMTNCVMINRLVDANAELVKGFKKYVNEKKTTKN